MHSAPAIVIWNDVLLPSYAVQATIPRVYLIKTASRPAAERVRPVTKRLGLSELIITEGFLVAFGR